MLSVGTILALLTLITNKPYLGWERHTWDPMILGVFLVGAAAWTRRWLSTGPNSFRNGFTAIRLYASDKQRLAALGTLSYAVRPGIPDTPASKPDFGGGRSGGGGAQGNF
ncbi:MAG: hypothetical protein A2992_09135 [Elusimicrobia bacterium RIFCSPLOWO2_01_FULL_59_12]|nr:MAG: hypothetical protein A2992_09135 [Elusimicrobia bacterium RIFCSPLOWO2_01_FULL_59_12]